MEVNHDQSGLSRFTGRAQEHEVKLIVRRRASKVIAAANEALSRGTL
jgi:hypothetical protein